LGTKSPKHLEMAQGHISLSLTLGEAVQTTSRRVLVLENGKNTAPCRIYIHVQASTAAVNKNSGIRSAITNGTPVPPPQVRTTPLDGGRACGATEDRRMARRRPPSSGDDEDFCSGGPNSSSDDLRADAAVRRPSPVPKLERQGRAEGCRVGGRSAGGAGKLVGGGTSSSCRGGRRHRERLRSRSAQRAGHGAAVSVTDDSRPSPRSLREGAGHRTRRGQPPTQHTPLPSPGDENP
jgi:hypothetical protein